MSHLEITEVILVQFNTVSNGLSTIADLFQINHLINYLKFQQQILFFQRHLIKIFVTLNYGLQIKRNQPLDEEYRINLTLVTK